jgi:hypothetical protein
MIYMRNFVVIILMFNPQKRVMYDITELPQEHCYEQVPECSQVKGQSL